MVPEPRPHLLALLGVTGSALRRGLPCADSAEFPSRAGLCPSPSIPLIVNLIARGFFFFLLLQHLSRMHVSGWGQWIVIQRLVRPCGAGCMHFHAEPWRDSLSLHKTRPLP